MIGRAMTITALLALPATLLAHGKEPHGKMPMTPPPVAGQTVDPQTAAGAKSFIIGTTVTVEATALKLRTRAGAITTVPLTAGTRFERGHCGATRNEVAANRRVAVYIDQAGRATRVLIGAAAPEGAR